MGLSQRGQSRRIRSVSQSTLDCLALCLERSTDLQTEIATVWGVTPLLDAIGPPFRQECSVSLAQAAASRLRVAGETFIPPYSSPSDSGAKYAEGGHALSSYPPLQHIYLRHPCPVRCCHASGFSVFEDSAPGQRSQKFDGYLFSFTMLKRCLRSGGGGNGKKDKSALSLDPSELETLVCVTSCLKFLTMESINRSCSAAPQRSAASVSSSAVIE